MALILHLRIVGASLLCLAVAHIYFGRRLGWREDLVKLTPINRQIFLVHAFFICLTLGLMGILSLLFPETLVARSPLGRLVLVGLVIFWGTRLIFQWFVYDVAHWRGHRENTVAHILFTLLWAYYTGVFAMTLRGQFGG
jgi:hypothetical protein